MGAEEMVHRAGADGMWKIGGYTGGPKSATGFLLGMLVHLIICFVWIAGVFVPLLCIVYFRSGWTLGLLLAISVYPMLMGYSPDGGWSRAGEWPAFRRALSRLGQLYYKECSYLIEDPDSMFETDEKSDKKFLRQGMMLCFHPHGILCWGFLMNGGFREELEGATGPSCGIAAAGLMGLPLFSWVISRWTGVVRTSSRKSVQHLMRGKQTFGILPGGFEEATISKMGRNRIFIKSRKGFVKYALRHGYQLVPCYTFGETDTYFNIQGLWGLRLAMSKMQLPGCAPLFGAWFCPVLPKPTKLVTVYGKPIRLPTMDSPSPADVDKWHALYVKELVSLYNRHAASYYLHHNAERERELEVW